MRPGQVLDYDVPVARLTGEQERKLEGAGPAGGFIGLGANITAGFMDFLQNSVFFKETEQGTEVDPYGLARWVAPGGGPDQLQGFEQYGPMVGTGEPQATDRFLPETRTPATAITPDMLDRTRSGEAVEALQRTYGAIADAQQELSNKTTTMRYNFQALNEAYVQGDLSLRPPALSQWEWDNLSQEQKTMVQEDLGYVFDPITGAYVPLTLEEPDYGMGDYGDYGVGGFGGGGDYSPKIYTGSRLRLHQGGEVGRGGGRLTVGHIPASHWRI
jgi:hypothetical protein